MSLSSRFTLPGLYRAEVEAELAKHSHCAPTPLEARELARLPRPLQRYMHAQGFVGRPHTDNARIVWREMMLRTSHGAPARSLRSEQMNFVREPCRIALMTGRLAGFVPFDGRDKYQHGHGDMRIHLLKVLTVGHERGPAMDASGLATVLAEALFVPSFALQSYVTWQTIDDRRVHAALTYAGVCVRGVFELNAADELVRFVTHDRFQAGRPARKVPWSVVIESWAESGGVRHPRDVRATWHEERGDYTYVHGAIAAVTYNLRPGQAIATAVGDESSALGQTAAA